LHLQKYEEDEWEVVGVMTRELKQLAMELDIPIIFCRNCHAG